jgi:hypothetical protein
VAADLGHFDPIFSNFRVSYGVRPMQPTALKLAVRAIAIAAIGALLAAGGCARLNMRGDNFRDDLARWNETQRRPAPAPTSDLWSFSEQGQQVERNLGVK